MVIGSNAIRYWYPDFPREPKDVDIIKNMYIKEYKSDLKVEWLENPVLQNWFTKPIDICTPNELYTLKISHIFWKLENNSWDKHMWDIQWLKEKGCKLIPELFEQLYQYWNKVHGKNKRSNLEMSGEDFFNNAIKFPIEHDLLHELLIRYEYFENQEKPTYNKILIGEVDVCMDKFQKLTEKEKFNIVFEEICCMAIERYPKNMYYKAQYEKMLKKFIINHCKIEEAIWIVENHKKLLTNIPFNFVEFLHNEIANI